MPRPHDPRQTFRARLKQARTRVGISQRELGIQAGLDPFVASARMNRYERGAHEPDLAMIGRLAEVLDVPVAYFFAADELIAQLLLAAHVLPLAQRDALLSSVRGDAPHSVVRTERT